MCFFVYDHAVYYETVKVASVQYSRISPFEAPYLPLNGRDSYTVSTTKSAEVL